MSTIYRQKPFNQLSSALQAEKLQRDKDYENAVKNLYATLPRDQAQTQKAVLWNDYLTWAIANGVYEAITPIMQLKESEDEFPRLLSILNGLRAESSLGAITVNMVKSLRNATTIRVS